MSPSRTPCSPQYQSPLKKNGRAVTLTLSPDLRSLSPPWSSFAIVVDVLLSIATPVVTGAVINGPLLVSVLDNVFDDQPNPDFTPKKKATTVMIRCVPKTEFIWFIRPHIYAAQMTYSQKQMKTDISSRKIMIMNMFQQAIVKVGGDKFDGPLLCLHDNYGGDWLVNNDAVDIETTNHRRLS